MLCVSPLSQAFLQTITFYCWESAKKYCRICCSEHLPPTNIECIYVPCIANGRASNVGTLQIYILDGSLTCALCHLHSVIFNCNSKYPPPIFASPMEELQTMGC